MNKKLKITLVCLAVIMSFCLLKLGLHLLFEYEQYETDHNNRVEKCKSKEKAASFNLLMESGDVNMNQNRYNAAYNDYQLALDLYPNDTLAKSKIKKCDSLLN